ncbi:WxL domain-containing protein [Companilactobacillus insicii]|uniref:WxL domain-containing protein n=1 Tax=Companilactobacillus insicii TaxID=1732567 RepID=UPI000F771C86|nr:WxL domain-containing protein [Companilactobacillus insicii]
MKKLIKGTAVLGAIALGAVSTVLTVAADTTTSPETSPAPQTSASDATILQTGSLALDKVPTISFGSQNYSVGKTTYASTAISALHVTNPGFASGWNVTVAQTTPFKDTASGSALTLKGATLSLDSTTTDPITADDSTNVSAAPSYITPLTLSSTAVQVESAAAGAGVGAYTTQYANNEASLYVPAGNLPAAYESTLTWTLSDAPS